MLTTNQLDLHVTPPTWCNYEIKILIDSFFLFFISQEGEFNWVLTWNFAYIFL